MATLKDICRHRGPPTYEPCDLSSECYERVVCGGYRISTSGAANCTRRVKREEARGHGRRPLVLSPHMLLCHTHLLVCAQIYTSIATVDVCEDEMRRSLVPPSRGRARHSTQQPAMCVCVFMRVYARAHTHTHTRMYVYTYNTYINTHIYI